MESSQTTYDIAIVGAGIVGSALAYFLSTTPQNDKRVALIDRAFSPLRGSTGHAQGIIGQLNESDILTRLAIDSVDEYTKIPEGFHVVGGLEVATSLNGIDRLNARYDMARKAGLPAELISPQQATQMAPDLVKEDSLLALFFPSDGAANATRITSFYQEAAGARGVELIESDAKQVQTVNGCVTGVMTTAGLVKAKRVVIATGIWATQLCGIDVPIPVVPVAHPYMYGQYREPLPYNAPWVRWPEHHVYARDHGSFYGIGSYAHRPVHEEPKEAATGDWREQFDATLTQARSLLPATTELSAREKFNGIFAMTPDNMPLVGSVAPIGGLYMAAAVWVTHAAGAAKFLTKILRGEEVDENTKLRLNPVRFQGRCMEILKQESLNGYNDTTFSTAHN
jgi:sarcosine oxidase